MPAWNPTGPRRWDSQQPYEHRCTYCDGKFPAVRPDAELCSTSCRKRRSRGVPPLTERPCTECGEDFRPATYRGKVCGNPCKQRAIRRRRRERDRVTT